MITELIEELKKDKSKGSLYFGWQSNIAMSMYDEMNDNSLVFFRAGKKESGGFIYTPLTEKDKLKTVNNCAKKFLELLIK